MADVEAQSEEDLRVFRNPYPAVITGIISVALAGLVDTFTGHGLPPLRFALLALGVLAAGIGVAIKPRSSLVLALAAATTILASFIGPKTEWDSARLALRVMAGIAALGAVLVPASSRIRRIVVSALIVFHFTGIATAIASADGSWLSIVMWTYLYRPYLQFFYLTNAYHFYAPEPGPAPLLWFCIEYEPDADGTRNLRWVKVPSLDSDGVARRPDGTRLWPTVEYTRRLSLGESANRQAMETNPLRLQALLAQRQAAGVIRRIPMRQDILPLAQFHEPSPEAKLCISSYVRHVADAYPNHELKADRSIIGIKVYLAIHELIMAPQFLKLAGPQAPWTYSPYFMGEFDKDGNLKPSDNIVTWFDPIRNQQRQEDRDPFLYWLIPILPEQDIMPTGAPGAKQPAIRVKNFVKVHAGEQDDGELP